MSWAFGYLIWSYLSGLVASLGFAGLFFKQLEAKTHGGVGGNARGVYRIDGGFDSKNNHTMIMMRLSKKVRNLGAQQLKSSCYPLIQSCLLDLPGSERYVPRFLRRPQDGLSPDVYLSNRFLLSDPPADGPSAGSINKAIAPGQPGHAGRTGLAWKCLQMPGNWSDPHSELERLGTFKWLLEGSKSIENLSTCRFSRWWYMIRTWAEQYVPIFRQPITHIPIAHNCWSYPIMSHDNPSYHRKNHHYF